jgi:competence protein ComEA
MSEERPVEPAKADGSWRIWWAVAFGIVGGLLGAGLIWLASQPPPGKAIPLVPLSTQSQILVHVGGAVYSPGIIALPPRSQVSEAIQGAGGFLPDADPQALNLAAFLQDGEQILVPTIRPIVQASAVEVTEIPLAGEVSPVPSSSPPTSLTNNQVNLININTATQVELETLPGIGAVIANRIIEYRLANGPFLTIDSIQEVDGIGPKTYEKIKDLITVSDQP